MAISDPCRRARAAGALIRKARWEAAARREAERQAEAPKPPKGGQVPRLAAPAGPSGGPLAFAGDAERRFDIRTASLWFGTRFELRDQTLFDHTTGHTYGVPLNDGVEWSETEIARALFRLAGHGIAHVFLTHAAGQAPVLRAPDEAHAARQTARQALIARAAGQHPGQQLAGLSYTPTGVAPIVQPAQDQGHPPPFGNRTGSTSL